MVHPRFRRAQQKPEVEKEDYAIILDIIFTNQSSFKNDEIAQAIGTNTYRLLELVPKEGVTLKVGQKVYIGDGKRDEIQYIKRTLFPDKLSGAAKTELLDTIQDIIEEKEEQFVNFFNTAGPITIRKHAFELIPGIGKKHLSDLIEERDKKPFESFNDIKERCSYLHDPVKAISERIDHEISGDADLKFFVKR